MSDPEEIEEIKQDDQASKENSKLKNKEDLFKAKKKPEKPRPPFKLKIPPNPEQRE